MVDKKFLAPKPQVTVLAIPSKFDEPDTELKEDTMTILIPYIFIEDLLTKSTEIKGKMFCYFYKQIWTITKDKSDIPIEVEEETVIVANDGEIVSHKYFVTI